MRYWHVVDKDCCHVNVIHIFLIIVAFKWSIPNFMEISWTQIGLFNFHFKFDLYEPAKLLIVLSSSIFRVWCVQYVHFVCPDNRVPLYTPVSPAQIGLLVAALELWSESSWAEGLWFKLEGWRLMDLETNEMLLISITGQFSIQCTLNQNQTRNSRLNWFHYVSRKKWKFSRW